MFSLPLIPIFVSKIESELSPEVVTKTNLPLTNNPLGFPKKLGLPIPCREEISLGLEEFEISNAASELLFSEITNMLFSLTNTACGL